MPVFFWLSGYFARAVYEHGGPGGFVRHRVARVLAPLAIALIPCSLALNALWDWGRVLDGRAAVAANVPKLQASGLPVTLGHLWYLYYLLAMSAVALAVVPVARRLRLRPLELLARILASQHTARDPDHGRGRAYPSRCPHRATVRARARADR